MSKRQSGSKNGPNVAWRDKLHWVDISAADQREIKEWVDQKVVGHHTVDTLLSELLDYGLSVKLTPPGDGGSYYFSLTSKSCSFIPEGHTLMFTYPLVLGGLALLLWYCQVRLLDQGIAVMTQKQASDWLDIG